MRRFALAIAALALCAVHPPAGATDRWKTLPPEAELPRVERQGHVRSGDARIWYGVLGHGAPVILLHGGMQSARSWGNQVPALLSAGYQVILIDSRGHGRSTLGAGPLHYTIMAGDVIRVMDALHVRRAAVVGWSDGANIGLILAMRNPQRLVGVYAFGANMRTDAIEPGTFSAPILARAAQRLAEDYARLSSTPGAFATLGAKLEQMQKREPDYDAPALRRIHGLRIAIADGDHEEFIRHSHTRFLARTIPGARLIWLRDASHFAPWQAPAEFNRSMIAFLGRAYARSPRPGFGRPGARRDGATGSASASRAAGN